MAANRRVTKEELDNSGLSLRDFLNKERGLTRKPPEGTKAGVYVPRPNTQERMTMEAQDNANRGLDENGQPLQITAGYAPRDEYTQSGKAMVDKQNAIAKLEASMKNYSPRRNSNDKEYKRGGKVKKMAKGGSASSRGDGIAQRGKTRGKFC